MFDRMTDDELLTEVRFAREKGDLERSRVFVTILEQRAKEKLALERAAVEAAAARARVAILPTAAELSS